MRHPVPGMTGGRGPPGRHGPSTGYQSREAKFLTGSSAKAKINFMTFLESPVTVSEEILDEAPVPTGFGSRS
jgi:hypothetical protein